MIKKRPLILTGFFLSGISSLGINPFSADPWIRPKMLLIFAGLSLILLDDIFRLNKWPEAKHFLSPALPLMAFTAFLFLHIFVFRYSFIQLSWLLPLSFLFSLLFLFHNQEDNGLMDIFLHGLTVVFALQSSIALYQFLFFQHSGFEQMGSALKWRTLGLIGNPNQLATFLALYFFRARKYWWSTPWQKTCTLLVGLALALTFSRGVFLALFLASLVNLKSPQWKKIWLPVLAGTVILLATEFVSGPTGFFSLDSVTGRFESYAAFFHGLPLSPTSFLLGSSNWNLFSPVHNQFLLTFEFFGMIGLLLLLWLTWKVFSRDKSLILFFIVFSLYDLPLLNPSFLVLMGLYLLPSVLAARRQD